MSADNTVIPNEVFRRKYNQRQRRARQKTELAKDLGLPRLRKPREGILITDRIPLQEPLRTLSVAQNADNYNPYHDTEELVVAAKAVASFIYASELPIVAKLALRNNILREILAINRYIAECKQIDVDTRLDGAAPYTEWYRTPEIMRKMLQEKLAEVKRKRDTLRHRRR